MAFGRLFGRLKKKDEDPQIPFGRYSDNNKSVWQVERWNDAEALFKEGKYEKSIDAFFDYLRDKEQDNAIMENGISGKKFTIFQGSKVVRGGVEENKVYASLAVARMPEPSIPVMRRLLEMNFHLYYSRFSLKGDRIFLRFETEIGMASPHKLYYGLKELCTKGDKQDDLLISEFGFLDPVDSDHIDAIPEEEKALKFDFLQQWIRSTIEYVETLDAEKFSGGISYLLLTLVFRIDYLIAPEGKILSELEKIASVYYDREDSSSHKMNSAMIGKFRKLLDEPREEIYRQLFRAKYTFAIVVPHSLKLVSEAIETALRNMEWYRDNNYPELANKVMEYGFAYCQYSYSLPKPLSELFHLFMRVNYAGYFRALGFTKQYYKPENNVFYEEEIREEIERIIQHWKQKYASFGFAVRKLKFDSLVSFNQSFLQEVAALSFE